MLLSSKYDIINSLVIKLVFDDGSKKAETVSVGDVVNCAYNKNGNRYTVEGTVKQITNESSPCGKMRWYIYIDSSTVGTAALAKIAPEDILDIDVLRKGAGQLTIHTPSNKMRVTDFRMNGNFLQVSTDYGKHWFKVAEITCHHYDVPEEYQELAARIDSLLPPYMNPGVRATLIVALVALFRDVNPKDMDIRVLEERLDDTIEHVAENASNIDYIADMYALADQGDEG